MEDFNKTKPLEPPPKTPQVNEKRLWIGNLDSRLTEYQLIKVLQKYGKVIKFDFLFHKMGPLKDQPRGYCFVTYETCEQAERAMQNLDGRLALSKKLSVKWAHLEVGNEEEIADLFKSNTPGSQPLEKTNDISVSTKIRAIEAKLKLMDENKDNLEMPSLALPLYQAPVQQKSESKTKTSHRKQRPYHHPKRIRR